MSSAGAPGASPRFTTTRWSLVLQARDKQSAQSSEALADLCQAYWYPLYVFIRKRSRDAHEAQDLTQGFFARLLEKDFLLDVTPERGRFRAFLLAAIKHYAANEWERARAKKRGGDRQHYSQDFDWESGESRFLNEPTHDLTAERLFDREWALALLKRVLDRLRDEQVAEGKGDSFAVLQTFLTVDRNNADYSQTAKSLNSNEAAIRVTVHRLRKRYRHILRDEISQTVVNRSDLDDEIRHLFLALSN